MPSGGCVGAAATLVQPLFLLRTQRGVHRLIPEDVHDLDCSGSSTSEEWDRQDGFLCLQSARTDRFLDVHIRSHFVSVDFVLFSHPLHGQRPSCNLPLPLRSEQLSHFLLRLALASGCPLRP